MYRLYFLLLPIVCNIVLAQDCVTENFENGIESFRTCTSTVQDMIVLKEYSALNMISPHPRSTKFITPQTTLPRWSCLISSNFTVTRGGILEVNRYTTSKNISDSMWIYIRTAASIGNGNNVVTGFFSPSQSDFVPGWAKFKMIVPGTGTFEGAVMFEGRDPGSIIAIDSYRFISPTYNKDLCKIYDDPITSTTSTTTTKEPQTTTTQRATESPTTITTTTPTQTTSDKSTATTATSTTTTTTAATTTIATPSTSTQAPRLSVSIQNRVKEFKLSIKKMFK